MAETTGIAWTESTWSPITGCERCSPGCAHCYAEQLTATRLAHQPKYLGLAVVTPSGEAHWTGEVRCHEDELTKPLHWKKPRMIFVNSMSDTFHKDVPDEFIAAIFGIMAAAPQHTFQVLTKRAERLPRWFAWHAEQTEGRYRLPAIIEHAAATLRKAGDSQTADRLCGAANRAVGKDNWPLPNVWLGVSVENQEWADERIPHLLATPAAVRFLSCEPLLGPVDVTAIRRTQAEGFMRPLDGRFNRVHWVIAGGESGSEARPCHVEWVRSLVRQCKDAGVACFVKQLGSRPVCRFDGDDAGPDGFDASDYLSLDGDPALCVPRLSDRKGGDPSEWPADLRVREFPEGGRA
jgi:protein gp37